MKKQAKKKSNQQINLSKKEKTYLVFSLFLFLFSIVGIYYFLFLPAWLILPTGNDRLEVETIKETEKNEIDYSNYSARFLDGVLVEKDRARLYPVAVILDNQPKFRPAFGLARAALVYELPTEGGTSRFLAIYNSDEDLDKVGPVRSARPYFIELALDSSAVLIHCGGSPESLARLAQARITSLNEFYLGNYFWRDKNLPAPHNIMINSQAWQTFLDNYGFKEAQAASWLFDNHQSEEKIAIPKETVVEPEIITIHYSQDYQSSWHYQAVGNYYQRRVKNQIQLDQGEEITAKNLILHYTSSQVLDEVLRLKIEIIGQGQAIICQQGTCQTGSWQKAGSLERLSYFDKNGQEIIFEPGPTWIAVITAGAKVDF